MLMLNRLIPLVSALLISVSSAEGAQLYMSAGKTVYLFSQTGVKVASAPIDASNFSAQGLAQGPDGRIYVAVNAGNHRVDSFSADLSSHTTGYVTNGQAGLFIPIGISFGPDDNLYVADNNPNRIERFFGPLSGTPGANAPLGANPGARWATVTAPVDVEFTPDGTLYASAATGANGTIYRFDSITGAPTAVATDLIAGSAVDGIAINAAGTQLFVRESGQVLKYAINLDHSLTKDLGFSISYPTGGGAGLGPYPGITFGPDGFLYAPTRTINGNPNPANNADFVLRINPSTGATTAFITGNVNTFTDAQNPTYLLWVPEPGGFTLAGLAIAPLSLFLRRQWRKRS